MRQYLFLFTIGPVQSFIAQARTTRDLFAGSAILSNLIDQAFESLKQNQATFEYIFPGPELESKPNRFLISLSWDKDEHELKILAQKVEQAVRQAWYMIAQQQMKQHAGSEWPQGGEEQIQSLLEVYWSLRELVNDDAYQEAQQAIEGELAAVKNARVFAPLEQLDRKCSVCGERTALIYSGEKNKIPRLSSQARKGRQHILSQNETLCAVCFAKRSWAFSEGGKSSYPSTAEVALMGTLDFINQNDAALLDEYKNLFTPRQAFDEQLFYEENLTESYFAKNDLSDSIASLPEIQKYQRQIKTFLETESRDSEARKKYKLGKYYAVIAFDGDSMGDLISGQYLRPQKDLRQFHKDFSKLLGEFAKQAKQYLTKPKGKAVYAGGDDFLGFINLDCLFEVMARLRNLYHTEVSQKLEQYLTVPMTFSAGIAVAHYKIPMSETLNWARAMEKDAKNISKEPDTGDQNTNQKNAWSLAVLKHSGEIHKTRFHWQEADWAFTEHWSLNDSSAALLSPLGLARLLTQQLSTRAFSRTFMNNLSEEFRHLSPGPENHDLFLAELKRLMLRSHLNTPDSEAKKIVSFICDSTRAILKQSTNLENFIFMLQITEFLAREVNNVQ